MKNAIFYPLVVLFFVLLVTPFNAGGSTVTIVNNCDIEVWAGIAGNQSNKECSSNSDCGGGECDTSASKPVCKQIFCGATQDCPINSFCGGIASYLGTCKGISNNECGANRFCDTNNKNYYPNPNQCSSDADCTSRDNNAKCDTAQQRCYFYQCGWHTCYYAPLPVKDFV